MPQRFPCPLLALSLAAGLLSCDRTSNGVTPSPHNEAADTHATAAAPPPIPPPDAPPREHAQALLDHAIAAIRESDPPSASDNARLIELILGFARLGETEQADALIAALDKPLQSRLTDVLYIHLTRRNTQLKTPWALAQIDAMDSDAQRITRLLNLAGGSRHAEIDPYNPTQLRSPHHATQADSFAAQALERIEARGGLDALPEAAETLQSEWVGRHHGHGDGRARAGVDHYPGRPAIYQSLARAHARQGDLDRAAAYVEHLGDKPELAVETLQEIAAYLYASGEIEASLATLRRASGLAAEAAPQRVGLVTRQQQLYGDHDSARETYAETARTIIAQPVEEDRDLVHLLNALSTTCQTLRELGADEEADSVIQSANERVAALPEEHPARYSWPMREASAALLAGDPASAAEFVALMPAQPRRVEMGHSVVVGWLHKGDAEGARAALDHLLAEAEATPRGGAGWYYNTAVIREEFEPWVALLERGEPLPIQYNHDERFRAIVALSQSGEYDAATAFLHAHSPTGTFKLKHLIVIAHYLHTARDDQRLRGTLAEAHRIAATEALPPGINSRNADGIPRFRFLDPTASRQQLHDVPQAQIYRPARVAFPMLGRGDRSRAAENWAVSGIADLFTLQLRWGMADHAAECLRACEHPWLASIAALFVIDKHHSMLEGQYADRHPDRFDIEQVARFEQALLDYSSTLSQEQQAHIRLGLRATPSDHPDVARRVIQLMPDLPHEAHHERSRNLTEWDRLVYPEDHAAVAGCYRHCQEAYMSGVLVHADAMRQSLEAAATQAELLDHPLSRAAMHRLIGGVALTFGEDAIAAAALDNAIAIYAEHAGQWEPPPPRHGRGDNSRSYRGMLTRVLIDVVHWRTRLEMDGQTQTQIAQTLRQTTPPSASLGHAQLMIGEPGDAHATLAQALRDATPQENNGDRDAIDRRRAIIDIYLDAGHPDLAWETVVAADTPWLSRELLPAIARTYARHAPAELMQRTQAISNHALRVAILNAAADALIMDIASQQDAR